MKIAVLSDIHGNLVRLEEARKIIFLEKIDDVICCGDVQDKEVLDEMDSWGKRIYFVFGNADYALFELYKTGKLKFKNITFFEEIGIIKKDKLKIAFCHYDNIARDIAVKKNFDVIFYGHTHTPWEEKSGNTAMINPGEISGQFGKPSFAIFETKGKSAILKILE